MTGNEHVDAQLTETGFEQATLTREQARARLLAEPMLCFGRVAEIV